MKTLSKSVLHFEVKASDDAKRTFSGLAAAYSLDQGMDRIEKGAFKNTIGRWRQSGKVLPLMDSHRYGAQDVIGKMIDAKETADGLEATFEMIPDDPDADAIYRRIKGGYIDGLSIGYEAVRWEMEDRDGERVRILKEIKLREISVVLWPMNEDARIDLETVKSLLLNKDLTPEQKAELASVRDQINAVLESPAATPAEKGLAPDDPKRIAVEERIRAITLRSLGCGIAARPLTEMVQ